jgi:glycosyltransferase involved in cell wall biosynthesis
LNVLFPLHGFTSWNGGLDFVRLLKSALSLPQFGQSITLHFAMPESTVADRAVHSALRRWRGMLAGGGAGIAPGLLASAAELVADHHVVHCSDDAAGVLRAARLVKADIVFPTMLPLGRSSQKRIGYLFDFQHRHMPHFFSNRTRRNRDRKFANIAADSDGLVVNSKAVARDVTQLLGVSAEHVLAMPFSPYAMPWSFDVDPEDARSRYRIEDRYLLVCNHFWKHKDHATSLRAFAILRGDQAFADLHLVLTGDPIDHRDPRHYARMKDLCHQLGVAPYTHFLGLIPKRDQLALLRGCAALMQPTLFEGGPGGGAVYDAVGLGVPAVVSDIPINREIDRGEVRFFRAGDPADLAEKTAQALATPTTRPARATLLANGDANLSRLGHAIADFLDRIVPGHSS